MTISARVEDCWGNVATGLGGTVDFEYAAAGDCPARIGISDGVGEATATFDDRQVGPVRDEPVRRPGSPDRRRHGLEFADLRDNRRVVATQGSMRFPAMGYT